MVGPHPHPPLSKDVPVARTHRIAAVVTAGLLSLAACAAPAEQADDSVEAVEARQVGSTSLTKVVAVGDIACPPGQAPQATRCRQADTAALAQSLQPDAVLALGDLQYEEGTLAAFQNSYDKSWGALKGITHPLPGNHEYRTPGAAGYYSYFADRQPGPPGYYARRLGAWSAYLLNTNCSEVDCAAQRTWLRNRLSSSGTKCALVSMHHPRYSSGEHGSQGFTRSFMRIAHRHRVDLVLAGHDHHYERFRRMDADGNASRRGFVSFVSGAGGKSHYEADPAIRGSRYRNDQTFGVLELRLRPDSFDYAFRTVSGGTPDAGTASCR